MKKIVTIIILLFLLQPLVLAQGASVDDIVAPISRIYDLIKGVVSVLGIIAITIAGAIYMFSGSNIQTRESAKGMVSYAVVGLVLVWVAPLLVNFLTSPLG